MSNVPSGQPQVGVTRRLAAQVEQLSAVVEQVEHLTEQRAHIELVPSSYFPATQVQEGAFSLVAGIFR